MAQQGFPAPTSITVDRNGTIPLLSVHVGDAQLGTYEAVIWPLRGAPRWIGRGDTIKDHRNRHRNHHRIVRTRRQLEQINRFIITVVITVTAVSRGPRAQWSWSLEIEQDGNVLAADGDRGAVTRPLFAVRRAFRIALV